MRITNTCVVCLNPRLYTWIFYHADMPTVVPNATSEFKSLDNPAPHADLVL